MHIVRKFYKIRSVARTDHAIDILVQRVRLEHLFDLGSNSMTVEQFHIRFPIFPHLLRPSSIHYHPDPYSRQSSGVLERGDSRRASVGPLCECLRVYVVSSLTLRITYVDNRRLQPREGKRERVMRVRGKKRFPEGISSCHN